MSSEPKIWDEWHEIGVDLRTTGAPDAEGHGVVTIDGQEVRGVEHVHVDAAADGIPRVTLRLVARRVTGVDATVDDPLHRIEALLRRALLGEVGTS